MDSNSEEPSGKRQREEETDVDIEMEVQSALENGKLCDIISWSFFKSLCVQTIPVFSAFSF